MGLLDRLFNRTPQLVYFQPHGARRTGTSSDGQSTAGNIAGVRGATCPEHLNHGFEPSDLCARGMSARAMCNQHPGRLCCASSLSFIRIDLLIWFGGPRPLIKGVRIQPIFDVLRTLDVLHLQTKRDPVRLDAYFVVNTSATI